MAKNMENCFRCGELNKEQLIGIYGYVICKKCKKRLSLFKDATIRKYCLKNQKELEKDPSAKSFREDINYRLDFIEKDYISKKIKLMHILDRLEHI